MSTFFGYPFHLFPVCICTDLHTHVLSHFNGSPFCFTVDAGQRKSSDHPIFCYQQLYVVPVLSRVEVNHPGIHPSPLFVTSRRVIALLSPTPQQYGMYHCIMRATLIRVFYLFMVIVAHRLYRAGR